MTTDFKKLEKLCKEAANRRRLAILSYLKKEGEAAVWDIAEAIKLSLKATSQHLAVLRAVDLVLWEQRSLEVFYRLAPPPHPIIETVLKSL
jgi:DNA-binding transcriptional ArsR family regulator